MSNPDKEDFDKYFKFIPPDELEKVEKLTCRKELNMSLKQNDVFHEHQNEMQEEKEFNLLPIKENDPPEIKAIKSTWEVQNFIFNELFKK